MHMCVCVYVLYGYVYVVFSVPPLIPPAKITPHHSPAASSTQAPSTAVSPRFTFNVSSPRESAVPSPQLQSAQAQQPSSPASPHRVINVTSPQGVVVKVVSENTRATSPTGPSSARRLDPSTVTRPTSGSVSARHPARDSGSSSGAPTGGKLALKWSSGSKASGGGTLSWTTAYLFLRLCRSLFDCVSSCSHESCCVISQSLLGNPSGCQSLLVMITIEVQPPPRPPIPSLPALDCFTPRPHIICTAVVDPRPPHRGVHHAMLRCSS